MMTTDHCSQRHSKSGLQKYIFNCKAYRLDGSNWIRLDKIFIDNQFDSKNSKGIKKVKVKGERGFDNTFIVKLTFQGKDYFYSMTQELQIHWLVHIIESKLAQTITIDPNNKQKEFLNVSAGYINKKSSFLGDWQKCFVTITPQGLTGSKDESSKPDLQIAQAKEIWTRFQLVEGQRFFVFKLRDFFKYEFGVPVQEISKWTKAFYSLIHFD